MKALQASQAWQRLWRVLEGPFAAPETCTGSGLLEGAGRTPVFLGFGSGLGRP